VLRQEVLGGPNQAKKRMGGSRNFLTIVKPQKIPAALALEKHWVAFIFSSMYSNQHSGWSLEYKLLVCSLSLMAVSLIVPALCGVVR
jgi:hypothetical protein